MASPSERTSDESAQDAPQQALLEISADGAIVWAAQEAATWWEASPERPMVGRNFVSLFAENWENPAADTWSGLTSRSRAGTLIRLTAQTPSQTFPVDVQLAPKGEPDAAGRDAFIASIERAAGPAPEPPSRPSAPAQTDRAVDALAEPATGLADTTDDLSLEIDSDEDTESPDAIEFEGVAPDEAADDEDNAPGLDDLPEPAVGEEERPEAPAFALDALAAGFEGARIGFFHIDLAAGTARYSESWKRLLGYEPEDVADEPDALAALVHPDDSEASPLALRHAGPFSAEIRLRTKEDSWRWMQLEGVRTAAGDATGRIDGLMLDAQERHDSDEQTARNEERFIHLSGRGTAGFFEIDLTQDTAWYSPEFRRALGRRADELGDKPEGFVGVLPPEDAQVGLAAYFQSISSGLPALVTRHQLMHADGRAVDFDAFLVLRRNRRGVIEHVCGLQASATEGRPAADDGESSGGEGQRTGGLAEAIQHALDAAVEPILIVDPEGRILHVNARAAGLAGKPPDRLATRSVHEVFPLVLRSTGAPAPEVIDRVLQGAQSVELDQSCALLGKDVAEEVAISCRPLLDARRKLMGATIVLRPLSEMPLSQAEMVKSNRMEALGRLACGIVHDFNNLLTTVVGGVSLALDKRDLAPLETALKACNNAKNLARQLLTFARGDVTGRRVQSLNDIIRETARMAGAGSRTTVELELSADLFPVNVVTSQLVQVFTNLILNAMQVMPTGGRIWVRTLNMPLGQVNSVNLPPGDYVRADVQDNGPGIPPENLARIFEPFFTTRAEGTGLGLAMVNSIVAQHEGAIEAASTVGSGTTFTLYFPRAQTDAVQEAPPKMAISYGSGRILIMDDDPDLCTIASGMLEMLGYQADTATSADDAILKFRKSREFNRAYAAVVLDLTMAGGPGGEDVVGRLREIDPAVKAIVSSGYATDENAEHYRKLGFSGILSKPYRSGDLGRVLKEVIGPPK